MKIVWGNIDNIEVDLLVGEFECLLCDHVETNPKYLVSDEGAFYRDCGSGLYI